MSYYIVPYVHKEFKFTGDANYCLFFEPFEDDKQDL